MINLSFLFTFYGCSRLKVIPESVSTEEWQTTIEHDHPLVGQWWRTADKQFIDPQMAYREVKKARFVLLGEKHDNPDHHRLQAQIVGWATEGNADSIVAFEMLNNPEKLSTADFNNTKVFAESIDWVNSGWPPFEEYEPIFATAISAGSTIVTASPTPSRMMSVARSLTIPKLEEIDQSKDLPQEEQIELEAEIIEAHCGYAQPEMIKMMIVAQQYKDAWMAQQLISNHPNNGTSVLIAGGGHTRKDRGVPWYFPEEQKASIITINFREVFADHTNPSDYGAEEADIIVFTPRVDNKDPCEAFKASLEKMKEAKEPDKSPPQHDN